LPATTTTTTADAAAAEAIGRASAPRPAHGSAPGLAERPVRGAHPAVASRVRGQRAEQPLRPQPRLQEQLFRRPTRPAQNADGVLAAGGHGAAVPAVDHQRADHRAEKEVQRQQRRRGRGRRPRRHVGRQGNSWDAVASRVCGGDDGTRRRRRRVRRRGGVSDAEWGSGLCARASASDAPLAKRDPKSVAVATTLFESPAATAAAATRAAGATTTTTTTASAATY